MVDETRNAQILYLGGSTRVLDTPVSILTKGESGSGKSNLQRAVVEVFPPEAVIMRTSLSAKAPVYGEDSLAGKILYLQEYKGAKDAHYLIRQQQSEGKIDHEVTNTSGDRRGTTVLRRQGSPVVLTTTTERKVFEDDETRFLSISSDDSPEHRRQVLMAAIAPPVPIVEPKLEIWHEAARMLCARKPDFVFPLWFSFVAAHLPVNNARVMRDWHKFLSFCKVIALIRSAATSLPNHKPLTIGFTDYCVAYQILNLAFTSTAHSVHEREIQLADAAREYFSATGDPIKVQKVAAILDWKESLVYKHLKQAILHGLVKYEEGTRERNLKRIFPLAGSGERFLPSPKLVFDKNEEIGERATYVDPLTGEEMAFNRTQPKPMERISRGIPLTQGSATKSRRHKGHQGRISNHGRKVRGART